MTRKGAAGKSKEKVLILKLLRNTPGINRKVLTLCSGETGTQPCARAAQLTHTDVFWIQIERWTRVFPTTAALTNGSSSLEKQLSTEHGEPKLLVAQSGEV